MAKAADVVGLYVDPPAKAIVLCVDEKPSIQALERAQGYWKLPNGRALTGQSHDNKRHGTTTTPGRDEMKTDFGVFPEPALVRLVGVEIRGSIRPKPGFRSCKASH